jgi:hypothetical protein
MNTGAACIGADCNGAGGILAKFNVLSRLASLFGARSFNIPIMKSMVASDIISW